MEDKKCFHGGRNVGFHGLFQFCNCSWKYGVFTTMEGTVSSMGVRWNFHGCCWYPPSATPINWIFQEVTPERLLIFIEEVAGSVHGSFSGLRESLHHLLPRKLALKRKGFDGNRGSFRGSGGSFHGFHKNVQLQTMGSSHGSLHWNEKASMEAAKASAGVVEPSMASIKTSSFQRSGTFRGTFRGTFHLKSPSSNRKV